MCPLLGSRESLRLFLDRETRDLWHYSSLCQVTLSFPLPCTPLAVLPVLVGAVGLDIAAFGPLCIGAPRGYTALDHSLSIGWEARQMGVFSVPIQVAHPRVGDFKEVEVVVDTGATYSVLPPSLLKSIGVEAVEELEVKMADGKLHRCAMGEARFRLTDGRERTTPVVFAPGDDVYLFGAVTLEEFGLIPDTDQARLVPARTLLMHVDGAIPGQRIHFG